MKVIGHTDDGGTIVEFSREESRLLAALGEAAEGRFPEPPWWPGEPRDFEPTGLFRAILLWLEAGCNLQKLEELVCQFEIALGIGSPEAPSLPAEYKHKWLPIEVAMEEA